MWTEQFEVLQQFSWVTLKSALAWPDIKKSMEFLVESVEDLNLSTYSPKVFQQYGYVKTFCSEEKLVDWRERKLATENRWVEVFKHMQAAEVPYLEFARIIEFVLCLPGTSAPVERVFSSVKKIWKTESTNLDINTLKSILHVKNNMDMDCVDFFEFIKTKPALLRQIFSQQKYKFKADVTPSTSRAEERMSIDTLPCV